MKYCDTFFADCVINFVQGINKSPWIKIGIRRSLDRK